MAEQNRIQLIIEALTGQAQSQVGDFNSALKGLGGSLALFGAGGAAFEAGQQLGRMVMDVGRAVALAGPRLSEQVEQLTNLSYRTNVGVNDLRVLRQVMIEAGQSPDALTVALTMMSRKLADGDEKLLKLVGDTRDPLQALFKVAGQVASGSSAAAVAFDAFGRSGGELAPVLSNLAERFDDVHKRMGDLDGATLQAAANWDELMDRMGTAGKRFLDSVGGTVLKVWDAITVKGSTSDPSRWAYMAKIGQPLPPEAYPSTDYTPDTTSPRAVFNRPAGFAGEPGPNLRKLLDAYQQFPDTGAGDVQLKKLLRGDATVQARLNISAEIDGKKPEQWIGDFQTALGEFSTQSANVLAGSIRGFFDDVFVYGQNLLSALGSMVRSIASDILSVGLQIAVGLGLEAAGLAIGGPAGAFVGGVGGKLAGKTAQSPGGLGGRAGHTFNIYTLDARSLVQQILPGGDLNHAQDTVRIGATY